MTPTVSANLGFRLLSLDTVDSTNDVARRLAEDGAAADLVVRAQAQTAGRGRHRRTWISERGNLYFSLLLRPNCELGRAPQLGFVAVNAIVESVAAVLPSATAVNCKWPNDVLVQGHKVGGMLLESNSQPDGTVDWLIIGIGVNVAQHPRDVRYPASSLIAEGAPEDCADAVFEGFLRAFQAGRAVWESDGFKAIRDAWRSRAAGLGEPIRINLDSEILDGVFEDIEESGALIVRRNGGERVKVTAGDVLFTSAA